jgi:dephospho-CoA kinase
MLKVGLTGGIASGKSVVGEMFVALGAHLIHADQIAHELMQPGRPVYDEVIRRFGPGILNNDGTVSRPRLAELAFGSVDKGIPSRVEELNRIIHPRVIEQQELWMEDIGRHDPGGVAIVEAALIIEAGAAKRFDRLIVVTCEPEQRAQRFGQRMKVDLETAREEVDRRMKAQMPDEEKIEFADYVIDNSGSLDNTRAQVREIYQELTQEAVGGGHARPVPGF